MKKSAAPSILLVVVLLVVAVIADARQLIENCRGQSANGVIEMKPTESFISNRLILSPCHDFVTDHS